MLNEFGQMSALELRCRWPLICRNTSLLCSDSSLNLSLCPFCFSVCSVARELPGRGAFLNVQPSSTCLPIQPLENARTNSPRRALARAGALGPHLCPGRSGTVTASRLLQSGGRHHRVFPG